MSATVPLAEKGPPVDIDASTDPPSYRVGGDPRFVESPARTMVRHIRTVLVALLSRRISAASPAWGSERIAAELRKLGIEVAKSTVERYRLRSRRPPSPTWRAFLANHVSELISVDFFTVATVRFEVLFVFIVLAQDRRRVLHWNVTRHPTAGWTAEQVVTALPWESSARYLLRDRDGIYGGAFRRRVAGLGLEEVLTAPRSP